jgi:20S proteasome alpha/beta subunit
MTAQSDAAVVIPKAECNAYNRPFRVWPDRLGLLKHDTVPDREVREHEMTVCVAIITEGMIFTAADRMLSTPETKFEPATQKIGFINQSLAVMFSGDPALHAEVSAVFVPDIVGRIALAPNNSIAIKDAADLYAAHWHAIRRKRAAAAHLEPLGLTFDSFISRQREMEPSLLAKVAQSLLDYRTSSVHVIIAGIDMRFGTPAPSVYAVLDGNVISADSIGFAAIGTGARHADSRFMLAGYSAETPVAEALLHLYSAKRDAETSPSVGATTDFYLIGPSLNYADRLSEKLVQKLDEEHRKSKDAEATVRESAKAEMRSYVDQLREQSAAKPTDPPPSAGTAISSTEAS